MKGSGDNSSRQSICLSEANSSQDKIVIGKKETPFTSSDLEKIHSHFGGKIVMDLGCGDGKWLLNYAETDQNIYIGVEPNIDTLSQTSRQASKKPQKGGKANVIYSRGSVERLPNFVENKIDHLFINYPWGSLLYKTAWGEAETLKELKKVAKDPKEFQLDLLFNYSVFCQDEYRESLKLPSLNENPAEKLKKTWGEAGWEVYDIKVVDGDAPLMTTWGKKLTKSGTRSTMKMKARIIQ